MADKNQRARRIAKRKQARVERFTHVTSALSFGVTQNVVADTLAERGSHYGDFTDNARYSQLIKDLVASSPGWGKATPVQREGLTMIIQKIARICNGDPAYADNWHDIQGYAKLVEDRLS